VQCPIMTHAFKIVKMLRSIWFFHLANHETMFICFLNEVTTAGQGKLALHATIKYFLSQY